MPEQPQQRNEEEVGRPRVMGTVAWIYYVTPHYTICSLGVCFGHVLHLAHKECTVVRGIFGKLSVIDGPGSTAADDALELGMIESRVARCQCLTTRVGRT